MTQPTKQPARGIKLVSPLQVSAHFFWWARITYALRRRRSHMLINPGYWHRSLLIVSLALGLTISLGWIAWGWLKPGGAISDNTKIVADRSTGTVYAVVAGRLYPATGLVSAQLIAGAHDKPTFVSAGEIAKRPQGPMVGIMGGLPYVPPISTPQVSTWSVCDTITRPGAQPTVTAIGGQIDSSIKPVDLGEDAVFITSAGKDYLLTATYRVEVDRHDKALGIPESRDPIPVSRALLNAVPARKDTPPRGRVVDAEPVMCASWRFDATERKAATTVHLYRGMPLTLAQRPHLIRSVGSDPGGMRADEVILLPQAANYVAATAVPAGPVQRDSAWIIAPNGVRFGVESDAAALKSLGLDKAPRPAPWAMLAPWPAGPELSRPAAMTQHSPADVDVLTDKPSGEQ